MTSRDLTILSLALLLGWAAGTVFEHYWCPVLRECGGMK